MSTLLQAMRDAHELIEGALPPRLDAGGESRGFAEDSRSQLGIEWPPARAVLKLKGGSEGSIRTLGGKNFDLKRLFPGYRAEADPQQLANYFVVNFHVRRDECGVWGQEAAHTLNGCDDVELAYYEGASSLFVPLGSVLGGGTPPTDIDWVRKAINSRSTGGGGTRIAHPDTGWATHPELDASALDLTHAWNTLNDSSDAVDPLNYLLFNGHGTATASLMISGQGGQLHGIAPQASVIPIRCAQSVVLILDTELAQAVWYAVNHGAEVLSISLGGYPSPALGQVLQHAVDVGQTIICASAGNVVPFVVYPAAYETCIAVAGSTPTDRPWSKSSFGPEVSISAPAQHVWVADFDSGRKPILTAGNGTSFSAPLVAGAAALWLAKHGRPNLLQRYSGTTTLQEVFRTVLAATARNPGILKGPGAYGDVAEGRDYSWESSKYGPGILDVGALLSQALPSAAAFPPPPTADTTLERQISSIFPVLSPGQISSRLLALEACKQVSMANELVQLLMTDVFLRERFVLGDLSSRGGPRDALAEPMVPRASWRDHISAIASPTLSRLFR